VIITQQQIMQLINKVHQYRVELLVADKTGDGEISLSECNQLLSNIANQQSTQLTMME
jgi:hypothetical protein